MSIEIDWRKVSEETSIAESLRVFLDEQMKNISFPSFIDNLSVTRVSLGTIPPQLTIRHIGDPFNDFYETEESGDNGSSEKEEEEKSPILNTESLDSGLLDDEDDEDEEEEFYEDSIIAQQIHMDSDALRSAHTTGEFISSTPPLPAAAIKLNQLDMALFLGNNNGINYVHNLPQNMIGLGTPHHGTETPTMGIFNQNTLLQGTASRQKMILNDKANGRDENDIQILVEFNYEGDLEVEFSVNLLLNFPSPKFITLPIKLRVTELEIHSLAVIAYLKNSVCFAFLCDISDTDTDYFPILLRTGSVAMGGSIVDYVNGTNNRERIDIIKNVRIESEIGEMETNVLRNVGKVEKFLVDQIRNLLRLEIAWPNWICLDMNENEEDQEEENKGDEKEATATTTTSNTTTATHVATDEETEHGVIDILADDKSSDEGTEKED